MLVGGVGDLGGSFYVASTRQSSGLGAGGGGGGDRGSREVLDCVSSRTDLGGFLWSHFLRVNFGIGEVLFTFALWCSALC